MAENICKYKAGRCLLGILQQQSLQPSVIELITGAVADLLEEAAGHVQAGDLNTKQRQQQQQQQPQQQQLQQNGLRDLQGADAVLQGVSLIIPRGKFDCGFFGDCLQVTNKQTSAEIPYGGIQHVLIVDAVPKQPNVTYMVLVMKSGQPVHQGKNALDLVVLQTKDQPELNIPAPEVCQHLGAQLTGAAAVVLSQLLASYIEGVTEDTFLTADSSVFSSSAGDLMVAANKGAQAGWLVPLSAGLCYVGKQGSFMPKTSISRVQFHRTGAGSSTFDITIKLTGAAKALELGQIDAAELPKLQAYCLDQRIKIGGADDDSSEEEEPAAAAPAAGGTKAAAAAAAASDDDDEEDEDFDPEATGSAQRGTKRRRVEAAEAHTGEESDDDSDDDDDDEPVEEDDASDMSSDPELVPSEELSGMDDDGDDF